MSDIFKVYFLLFICLLLNGTVLGQHHLVSGNSSASAEIHRSLTTSNHQSKTDQAPANYLSTTNIQQKLLAKDQTLIEFFVEKERLCIFFFTTDRFEKAIVPLDFPLIKWVKNLKKELKKPAMESSVFYNDLYELYEKIWQPVEVFQPTNRILIKANSVLKQFPFDALLTAPYRSEKVAPDFLVQKYALSYTTDLNTYHQKQVIDLSLPKGLLTINSDNKENVLSVGGDVMSIENSTTQTWQTYRMIHCEIDLRKEIKKSIQTNLLLLNDQSGLSFSNRNIKAAIGEFWQGNINARNEIQALLYRHLFKDRCSDQALQYAKKNYLIWSNKVSQHPHYWASMQLSGVAVPIHICGFRWDLLLWVGLVSMLFGGWWLLEKRII